MTTKSIFSKRLNLLMKERFVTQAMLADAVGITKQSISMYVNTHRVPDIEVFKKMCNFFNVSADYFLGINDQRTSNIEDKAIHNAIGLSDKAIEKLKKYKEYLPGILIPTLNKLIEDEANPDALSLSEPYRSITTISDEKLEEIYDYYEEEGAQYTSKYEIYEVLQEFGRGTLLLIEDYLKNIIDEDEDLEINIKNLIIDNVDCQRIIETVIIDDIKNSLNNIRDLEKEEAAWSFD